MTNAMSFANKNEAVSSNLGIDISLRGAFRVLLQIKCEILISLFLLTI